MGDYGRVIKDAMILSMVGGAVVGAGAVGAAWVVKRLIWG